jgi:8-amino-7-oxononanoate synthase
MADPALLDMASNDYLCLAHKPKLLKRACERVARYPWHAPKSSLFVGGYHPIHRDFETALCEANGFERGVVAGSGFLANLGLIEALVRRGDTLFIDESYHASGMVATKLVQGDVVTFRHNDMEDLIEKIDARGASGRRIIAVEGIYSMEGDRAPKEIFEIADWFEALLIVDEAHSSGTAGPNLLGVFDAYGIEPGPNHIKMGTLGKAYGSYGAYILASDEVVRYLHNRAKPLIYATAPSLLDIALAHEGFLHIWRKKRKYAQKIRTLKRVVKESIGKEPDGMIVPVSMPDIRTTMEIRDRLEAEGYQVGAIRPPTVPSPILRVILRTCIEPSRYEALFGRISELLER